MGVQDWLVRNAIVSKLTERGLSQSEAENFAKKDWVMQIGRDYMAGKPIPEGMKTLTKDDVRAYKQRAQETGVPIERLFQADFYGADQPNAQLPLGSGSAAPPSPTANPNRGKGIQGILGLSPSTPGALPPSLGNMLFSGYTPSSSQFPRAMSTGAPSPFRPFEQSVNSWITGAAAPANRVEQMASRYVPQLMQQLGITSNQARGIIAGYAAETGNFTAYQEQASRYNPAAGQPGKGGFGLAMYTNSDGSTRKTDFLNWANANGYDLSTTRGIEDASVGYTIHEMQTTESRALTQLKATDTVGEATRAFIGSSRKGSPLYGTGYLRPGADIADLKRGASVAAILAGDIPGVLSNNPEAPPPLGEGEGGIIPGSIADTEFGQNGGLLGGFDPTAPSSGHPPGGLTTPTPSPTAPPWNPTPVTPELPAQQVGSPVSSPPWNPTPVTPELPAQQVGSPISSPPWNPTPVTPELPAQQVGSPVSSPPWSPEPVTPELPAQQVGSPVSSPPWNPTQATPELPAQTVGGPSQGHPPGGLLGDTAVPTSPASQGRTGLGAAIDYSSLPQAQLNALARAYRDAGFAPTKLAARSALMSSMPAETYDASQGRAGLGAAMDYANLPGGKLNMLAKAYAQAGLSPSTAAARAALKTSMPITTFGASQGHPPGGITSQPAPPVPTSDTSQGRTGLGAAIDYSSLPSGQLAALAKAYKSAGFAPTTQAARAALLASTPAATYDASQGRTGVGAPINYSSLPSGQLNALAKAYAQVGLSPSTSAARDALKTSIPIQTFGASQGRTGLGGVIDYSTLKPQQLNTLSQAYSRAGIGDTAATAASLSPGNLDALARAYKNVGLSPSYDAARAALSSSIPTFGASQGRIGLGAPIDYSALSRDQMKTLSQGYSQAGIGRSGISTTGITDSTIDALARAYNKAGLSPSYDAARSALLANPFAVQPFNPDSTGSGRAGSSGYSAPAGTTIGGYNINVGGMSTDDLVALARTISAGAARVVAAQSAATNRATSGMQANRNALQSNYHAATSGMSTMPTRNPGITNGAYNRSGSFQSYIRTPTTVGYGYL